WVRIKSPKVVGTIEKVLVSCNSPPIAIRIIASPFCTTDAHLRTYTMQKYTIGNQWSKLAQLFLSPPKQAIRLVNLYGRCFVLVFVWSRCYLDSNTAYGGVCACHTTHG